MEPEEAELIFDHREPTVIYIRGNMECGKKDLFDDIFFFTFLYSVEHKAHHELKK